MSRREAQRAGFVDEGRRGSYQRDAHITDTSSTRAAGSARDPRMTNRSRVPSGATPQPGGRSRREVPDQEYLDIEPNERGGTFSDQFLATMERILQQKQQAWTATLLEIFIPLVFVVGCIILWAAFGDVHHDETSMLNYSSLSSGIIPTFYQFVTCNNVSMGIIPGLADCTTVRYDYNCSGDESTLPVHGLCFDSSMGGSSLIGIWVNAMLGNAASTPPLDTVIMMQWTARKSVSDNTDGAAAATLAAAGMASSTRYNAVLSSGKLYFAPRANVPSSLIDYLNASSIYFKYVYGGIFETVEAAETYVKNTVDYHWAIVEINAFNKTDFDVVLHMNSTALPPLTDVLDASYTSGFQFDRAEMYLASGFNTLQKALYDCYLQNIGYTKTSLVHPYIASFGYQPYTEKKLLNAASSLIAFILVLSFLYPVVQLTKKIVLEKELRIREAMLIMGLSNTSLHLSWFVTYAMQYFAECVLMVTLLKFTFMPSGDAFVTFVTFYLFALSTIPLSGLIAAFFSKARLASMLAPLIFFALSVPTFAFASASPSVIVGVSLMSPTAFASALANMLTLEPGTGFGWNDFRNAALSPESYILYALLVVDFAAYSILMFYFDAVLPKDWGTTKHPLFFIIDPVKALCNGCGRQDISMGGDNEDGRAENGVFETTDDRDATVRIVGLRKVYSRGGKKFVAVNNLYWAMSEKEISVMLGHNGAGKTTAMNMMTGMIEPDEGDCYICGYSVRTELTKVRQQIGYCPQHNILWDELTCREHLEYYGKIKGLYGPVLENAVCMILREVDLLDKIDYASSALSGGMKRKLSVAIAFVGRSPLIFLDEPTAGMDVSARRYTWELLRRMSEAHSIMLTTHFMDEADLLGSRIGIMSHGSLQCSGSSLFLKSRLGVGYNMSVSIDPDANAEDVDRLVVSLVPSATASNFNGCEITYKLPIADIALFPALLAGLEDRGETAGVRGFSLSATTLEEVFLQIALDNMNSHKAKSAVEEDEATLQAENHAVWDCELMVNKGDRLWSQFKAMMGKRLWNALRDRKMQCFQIVCPVVCILLAMLLTLVSFTTTGTISFSNDMFDEEVQMQVSGCLNYIGELNNVVSQGANITDLNFANAQDMSFYGIDTQKKLTMPRYTSVFCNDSGLENTVQNETSAVILFYNTSAYHTGGLVFQQFYSWILQYYTGDTNRTFKLGTASLPSSATDSDVQTGVQTILIGAIVMVPFTFLPSNPVAWIVKERECKARHLQNVSGLSFYVYWAATFLFDVGAYVTTLLLVIIIFCIFQRKEYVGAETFGPTIVMFMVYGVTSTVAAYVVSFAFDEHSAAQSVTMAVSFVAGFLLVMMVFILSLVDSTKDASKHLRWPFRLVPSYCVGESIINLAMDRQQALLRQAYDPWGMDVIGWPCVYMAIEFPILLIATLIIDHPRRRMWGQKGDYDRSAPAELIEDEDSDVEDERKELYKQERNNVNNDVVRVVDLRKAYKNGKVAVRNLAFSILPDEVFGFLGTNGAGKTTTMSMLSQEFIPSSGNAYVCGYDIVSDSEEALQCIGYCPQFDATLDLLTVEEHLYLYAGVRGIRYEDRDMVVSGLMRLCEILDYRKTTSAQLSGGNRRKLSVALSLMGSPQVVFLDEPSAGMDPVARRGLWTAIQKVSQNCSVVLTTHHLEEVEELADTVAIMADGALRCIGDKMHLKDKYGSGFELNIRIARKDMRSVVQHFVEKCFPAAVLNEFKGQRFVFALPQDTKLSETFWQLQQNKERLQITDYSVSQTSIEQVFLRISEEQEEREELGNGEREVRFVKSHATPHDYRGNATAKRRGTEGAVPRGGRRRASAELSVRISSDAMEAYRKRKLAAGIADTKSGARGNSSRPGDTSDSDDNVTVFSQSQAHSGNGGGGFGYPSEMRSAGDVAAAPVARKRSALRFVGLSGNATATGYSDPQPDPYAAAGAQYGNSGYTQSHQQDQYGYGYANTGDTGSSGYQQAQKPYDTY